MNRFASALFASVLLAACGGSTSTDCPPGTEGCRCEPIGCGDGLACGDDGLCEGLRTASLPAIDPVARSCEVLVEDGEAKVAGARFEDSVDGVHVRQAPKTAVTFYARRDQAIGASAVQLELLGAGSFRVATATCFDADGHPIPGGGIAAEATDG